MSIAGDIRSANVGMSSEKRSENLLRRKSKVSYSTSVGIGLVGPKENPKGESDGYQVNIPELHTRR